jgi:hypothetical protein
MRRRGVPHRSRGRAMGLSGDDAGPSLFHALRQLEDLGIVGSPAIT